MVNEVEAAFTYDFAWALLGSNPHADLSDSLVWRLYPLTHGTHVLIDFSADRVDSFFFAFCFVFAATWRDP